MDELAQKLYHDHKNPVVKIDLSGTKLFFKACTPEDEKKVEKNQSSLENVLRHLRVERRCARSKADWCPNINMAKVTKVVKGLLENFGFQDKNGIFLYPEEMLFLLETNRIEITYKKVSLTIQDCYNILLHLDDYQFRRYLVYKKIVSSGYRVISHKEMLRKISRTKQGNAVSSEEKCSKLTNKRKMEESGTRDEIKKIILDSNTDVTLTIQMNNLFEKMRSNAPRMYSSHSSNKNPDYCVFSPNNKNRTNWDFNVYICEDNMLPVSSSDKPSVYAFCVDDSISFFTAHNVNLPCLQ